jgi:hypothetical protein
VFLSVSELDPTETNVPDCYPSGLSDELVDFLLVALSCSSSQSTTEWLIGNICVSVLKMFHQPSDAAGTHLVISIHTIKSLTDDSCLVSLFSKKLNESMLMKRQPFSYSA